MKRLLTISALLLFSVDVFAEEDEICLVEKYKEGMEFENCNAGDILLLNVKPKDVRKFSVIASHYCDYQQAITFGASYSFTCVLKTTTPRKIKEDWLWKDY